MEKGEEACASFIYSFILEGWFIQKSKHRSKSIYIKNHGCDYSSNHLDYYNSNGVKLFVNKEKDIHN